MLTISARNVGFGFETCSGGLELGNTTHLLLASTMSVAVPHSHEI
jgi:hypothetical protein